MPGLFSPLRIRNQTLPNRLVLPPMATSRGEDGAPAAYHLGHYGKLARAGSGTIIVEHTYVLPNGRLNDLQLGLVDDGARASWEELARTIKEGGSRAILQITHAGSTASAAVVGKVVGPSAVRHPRGKDDPQELSASQLSELMSAFVSAAVRAREAGFDGVEIHGAHGYLLNQFLSPLTNQRTDEYGGSLSGRARFPLEVVRAVREALDSDCLVFFRLGAHDFVPGGFSLSGAREVAGWLAGAGVDVIDISGGMGGYPRHGDLAEVKIEGTSFQPLYFLPLVDVIKAEVGVPVIFTGGVTDPAVANLLIERDECDLVGVARAQLADPSWAEKARQALDA